MDVFRDLLTDPEALYLLILLGAGLLGLRLLRQRARWLRRLTRSFGLHDVQIAQRESGSNGPGGLLPMPALELVGKLGAREVRVRTHAREQGEAGELELRVQVRPGVLPAALRLEPEAQPVATRVRDLLDGEDALARALRLDASDDDAARRLLEHDAVRDALSALVRAHPDLRLLGEEIILGGLPPDTERLRMALQLALTAARALEQAARTIPLDAGAPAATTGAPRRVAGTRAARGGAAIGARVAPTSTAAPPRSARELQAAYARTWLFGFATSILLLVFALAWIVVWVQVLGEWMLVSRLLLGVVIGVLVLAVVAAFIAPMFILRCPACGESTMAAAGRASFHRDRCPGCGVRLR